MQSAAAYAITKKVFSREIALACVSGAAGGVLWYVDCCRRAAAAAAQACGVATLA
jgi:hypothetical protein